jgi:hypothetical protein
MLFLDKCVKTVLLEEGQVLVSLEDLGISDDNLNTLFEGIYEQARPYVQSYVKKTIKASTSPLVLHDAVSIKRVCYDTYMNQYNRVTPDIPQSNWDFNPHTKTFTTFASMSYIVEYLCYPKCGNLEVSDTLQLNLGGKATVKLPCKVNPETFVLHYNGKTYSINNEDETCYSIKVNSGEDELTIATIDKSNLNLNVSLNIEDNVTSVIYSFTTANYAIEEWDMKCELFVTWFKAALLSMIGAIKEQAGNIDTASMPFDINRDTLLTRARELYAKLDELKVSKSNWWEW